MIKVVFLPFGGRKVASSRYRLYQFLEHAEDYDIMPIVINWPIDQTRKVLSTFQTALTTLRSDCVFIQKRYDQGALLANSLARRSIFDFDDAIWLPRVVETRSKDKITRLSKNLERILSNSTAVIVGNAYLEQHARKFNSVVNVIPTTVDLNKYIVNSFTDWDTSQPTTIGWVGSSSTLRYLHLLDEVFTILAERYHGNLRLKVVSDEVFHHPRLAVENVRWTLEREISDLLNVDIGIMPLLDEDWERGKCGFKLIQYMALSKPAVASPVGVNQDIITHGENGFLASDTESWVRNLSLLIDNTDLRKKLGSAARTTIEQYYSLQAVETQFFEIIHSAMDL